MNRQTQASTNSAWVGQWRAGRLDGTFLEGSFGPASGQELFDLASLTKIVCTGSLLAEDCLASTLSWPEYLSTPLQTLLPELKGSAFAELQLGEAWEHRSALPAHIFLFTGRSQSPVIENRKILWAEILQKILGEKAGPLGEVLYSDLGFLLLGLYLERKTDRDLKELWEAWKSRHGLSPAELSFGVSSSELSRVVPTESRHAAGQVNDDNAYALGGIAPHAGLFGDCAGLWHWLQSLLAWQKDEAKLSGWLNLTNSSEVGSSRFYKGWDQPSGPGPSQAGKAPPGVLGHLGFTGTALWWHPPSQRAGILLTNRVFPADSPESKARIKSLRHQFFTALWQDKLKELCKMTFL